MCFFVQVSGGIVTEGQQVLQPLKVLRNLVLMPDRETSYHICHELELPAVLFDMIQNSVENSEFIKVYMIKRYTKIHYFCNNAPDLFVLCLVRSDGGV